MHSVSGKHARWEPTKYANVFQNHSWMKLNTIKKFKSICIKTFSLMKYPRLLNILLTYTIYTSQKRLHVFSDGCVAIYLISYFLGVGSI